MAAQTGRIIGRVTSYVAAGVLFAAGLIVGLIPYSEGGYSRLCPSAIGSLTGATTQGQSLINMFSGGRCDQYATTMTVIMLILMFLGVLALVGGILLRKRRDAAGGPQGPFTAYPAPAMPGHAPGSAEGTDPSPYAGSGYPAQADPAGQSPAGAWQPAPSTASGSFDTKLLVVGIIAVAGVVLTSFIIDWLGFLPGIIELLLWTAVGLTAIWQIKRRLAAGDPMRLAEAETWNPAVVARGIVAFGRGKYEAHRAARREAERAQTATVAVQPAPDAEPAATPFKGDDGMAEGIYKSDSNH